MQRREFIKGSAILGAVSVISPLVNASGLLGSPTERKVFQVINTSRLAFSGITGLRAFAGDYTDYVSPFVVFDEFGPMDLAPKQPLRIAAHPHAGIIPITYFLSGSGHHRDSLNNDYQYGNNQFLLFTSGRGAIHMEESGRTMQDNGGIYHGFQIWLNLPARLKFIPPSTVMYSDAQMGFAVSEGYTAKVIFGEGFGVRSTIPMLFPVFYYHIRMKPGATLEVPADPTHNAFLYLVEGELEVQGNRLIKKNQLVLYRRNADYIRVFSKESAELLILGGKPNNEPVYSYGPFVMNSEEEIRNCLRDYRAGKMGNPDLVNGNE
jgi:redox-sensitive bicupin YhaK (pirin superfamily)